MKLSLLPLLAVSCLSFAHTSAQAAPEMNNTDSLLVAIDKKEFGEWLRTKAF